MRKVVSIFAVAVMTMGLFSCEAETNVSETEALFEGLDDQDATEGNKSQDDDRQ